MQHFEIVLRAEAEALRFEKFILRFQNFDSVFQLGANRLQRAIQLVRRRDELFGWKKCHHAERFARVAGQRIEAGDRIQFVAEEFQPDCFLVRSGGINFDHVATDAELAARKTDVVALIEHVDQPTEHCFARSMLAAFYREQHSFVIFRRRDAVNAGNARDHDGVAPCQQCAGRGQSQPLDLFVNRRVLFDVGVGARDVSFRLVVIEIAHEIFDRVFRKELFELRVKLRGECFVVRNDQRRPVQFPDHIGDRECFARAGDAEKRLVAIACLDRFDQLGNGLPLVAARLIIRFELKRHSAI